MCEHLLRTLQFHIHQLNHSAQIAPSVSQASTSSSPCHITIRDVEKDEEAFVVGRLGLMGVKDWARLGHCLQV